jgi:hypothetical protein
MMEALPRFSLVDAGAVMNGALIPSDYKAIVSESGKVVAMASNRYKLVQHQDVLDVVETTFSKDPEASNFKKKVMLDNDGARMRAEYIFNDQSFMIGNEVLHPKVDVFNSCDLTWSAGIVMGGWRLICSNGAIASRKIASYRKKHMPALTMEEVKRSLDLGLKGMNSLADVWQKWQSEPLALPYVETAITELHLNQKEETKLIELKETESGTVLNDWMTREEIGIKQDPLTKWMMFNIVTQFTTHEISSEMRRIAIEAMIQKVFYNQAVMHH